MADRQTKASVIGIGNLLMTDEGFGIHVIRFLEKKYSFPSNVQLVDCGTAGIYMAPVFEQTDVAFLVDAAAIDGYPPGTVIKLDYKGMTGRQIQTSMSPHQVGVLEVLEICKLRGNIPSCIEFYLVIPKNIDPGLELSSEVRSRVTEVAKRIVKRLREEGFDVRDA